MSGKLSHNSEYIRRDYNKEQEVSTELNFKSELQIKNATKDNNPVTLGQASTILNNAKKEVLNELKQSPSFEAIKSCVVTFFSGVEFSSYNAHNITRVSSGTRAQYSCPGSQILFLLENGEPLFPVAYTKGGEGNWNPTLSDSVFSELAGKNFYVWLAKASSFPENLVKSYNTFDTACPLGVSIYKIADPDNMTEEEINHLAQFGDDNLIRVSCRYHYPFSRNSNSLSWSHPLQSLTPFPILSSSLTGGPSYRRIGNLGVDSTLSCDLEIEFDTTSQVFGQIKGISWAIMGSHSLTYGISSVYGNTHWYRMDKTVNGYYKEISYEINRADTSRVHNKMGLIIAPFNRDEDCNGIMPVLPEGFDRKVLYYQNYFTTSPTASSPNIWLYGLYQVVSYDKASDSLVMTDNSDTTNQVWEFPGQKPFPIPTEPFDLTKVSIEYGGVTCYANSGFTYFAAGRHNVVLFEDGQYIDRDAIVSDVKALDDTNSPECTIQATISIDSDHSFIMKWTGGMYDSFSLTPSADSFRLFSGIFRTPTIVSTYGIRTWWASAGTDKSVVTFEYPEGYTGKKVVDILFDQSTKGQYWGYYGAQYGVMTYFKVMYDGVVIESNREQTIINPTQWAKFPFLSKLPYKLNLNWNFRGKYTQDEASEEILTFPI